MSYFSWPRYVPVAERKANAARELKKLEKKGETCQPIVINGRTIASTFWGKKWCEHLESYSDFDNRLPRGRTYVRNGSVVDLQISAGQISARVFGSSIYKVTIKVEALEQHLWKTMLQECAGKVASLIELLKGKLSSAVMEVVTRPKDGLFPVSKQIQFSCSCPDSAYMCKHIAATLYGVGARLDKQPELLFLLRHVDPQELILQAGNLPTADASMGQHQQLDNADLSALFGIDLDEKPVAATSIASIQKKSTPPHKKGKTGTRPIRAKTMSASELIARGIPRHKITHWRTSGVLLITDKRGVYKITKHTEEHISAYLERI